MWALLDEEAQTVRHFSKRPFVFVVAMLSLYKKKSFTGKDGGVVQTITKHRKAQRFILLSRYLLRH